MESIRARVRRAERQLFSDCYSSSYNDPEVEKCGKEMIERVQTRILIVSQASLNKESIRNMAAERWQFYRHLIRICCIWSFFGAIVGTFAGSGIHMTKLSKDPAQLASFPIYYGLLSNLGILVWAAGGIISLFASFHVEGANKIRSLLRWAGILTLILLLDDFFLIHDILFPRVLRLPEWLVYLFYLVAFPLFFLRHLKAIFAQTEYRILALGVFLLGLSFLIDMNVLPGGIDVEDGFKLAGMVAYSYYWIVTSHRLIVLPAQSPSSAALSQ
jgi:hypothetical protein